MVYLGGLLGDKYFEKVVERKDLEGEKLFY